VIDHYRITFIVTVVAAGKTFGKTKLSPVPFTPCEKKETQQKISVGFPNNRTAQI
jgi:hypothetical protein